MFALPKLMFLCVVPDMFPVKVVDGLPIHFDVQKRVQFLFNKKLLN